VCVCRVYVCVILQVQAYLPFVFGVVVEHLDGTRVCARVCVCVCVCVNVCVCYVCASVYACEYENRASARAHRNWIFSLQDKLDGE
jgi:hypothetical protein